MSSGEPPVTPVDEVSVDGAPPSLYDRLGGAEIIDGAITEFYSRVLNDPGLAPFFDGVDLDKLGRMQTEFFTVALGGPGSYAGMSLAEAHRGRGIEPHHIADFTGHLLETLLGRGMSPEVVDEVVARITVQAQEVLDSAGESG